MVIITRDTFPVKCFRGMAEYFLENLQFPDFIKPSGPYFRVLQDEGIEAITVYEYHWAHKKEVDEFLKNRKEFFQGIEGVTSIEIPCMRSRETFDTIGKIKDK